MVANPEDEVHRSGGAPESAEAGCALGAMALAMQSDLGRSLSDGEGDIGKSAGLERTVEVGWGELGEPFHLEALGVDELLGESDMGFRDMLFFFVDEGLAKGKEEPIAICDENVVKELAEIRILSGGLVILDRAKEV